MGQLSCSQDRKDLIEGMGNCGQRAKIPKRMGVLDHRLIPRNGGTCVLPTREFLFRVFCFLDFEGIKADMVT